MTTTADLRERAERIPVDSPEPLLTARQRGLDAAKAVDAALAADPTVAERAMRDIDVLGEVMRRLVPLARAAGYELERRTGADVSHHGRINPAAPEELQAISERCTVIAARITAAVLPDWDMPERIRELSASRMPGDERLAEIADELRRAVAPALGLRCPDPEAVRLLAVADQIDHGRMTP